MTCVRATAGSLTGCFVLVVALSVSAPARSQVIDAVASGGGQCFAFTDSGLDTFIVTENIVSQMCDAVSVNGDRVGTSGAAVRVLFNTTPFVDVQTVAEQENGNSGPNVRANGQAELTYLSTTRFIDGLAPPFIPGLLPLRVAAPWAITDFGTEGMTASIRLTILDSDGAVFFSDTQTLFSGHATDTYELFGAPEPFEPFTITIESTCSSVAPANGISLCQAVIDPLIEFDQPTFDATFGGSGYVLADFWEIAQSGNLVPEPGFGAMIAAGSLGLALVRRRRGVR